MFQFHRILQYARPRQESQRPFFWLFMDHLLLTEDDQVTTARFLQVGRGLACLRVWDSHFQGLCCPNVCRAYNEDIRHLRHRLPSFRKDTGPYRDTQPWRTISPSPTPFSLLCTVYKSHPPRSMSPPSVHLSALHICSHHTHSIQHTHTHIWLELLGINYPCIPRKTHLALVCSFSFNLV